MTIVETISQIQVNLRQGRFRDEAAVSLGVVLPILNALEWPVFDTSVVIPQYQVAEHPERRVVDFALVKLNGHLAVFIEVKRVGGIDADGERQLFEYAFHKGVPLAVLTDGQEWNFYLPLEEGGYQDRQVYKFDLLSHDSDGCKYRLHRYLAREEVLKDNALINMRADHQYSIREGAIEKAMPQAWIGLLLDAEDSIVKALASRVAELCGYEPAGATCAAFLSAVAGAPIDVPIPTDLHPEPIDGQMGFTFQGQRHSCTSLGSLLRGHIRENDGD